MKKTILLESYTQSEFFSQLLSHQQVVVETEFLSLSSWLEKQTLPIDEKETFIKAHQALQKLQPQLEVLGPVIGFADTTRQLLTFAKECITYDINLEDLPKADKKENELYLCLITIFPLLHQEQHQQQFLKTNSKQSHIEIAMGHRSLHQQTQLDWLIKHGATTHELPSVNPQRHFYHAQNPRQEMEACLQHLLSHHANENVVVVLADYANQVEAFKAIANRYHVEVNLHSPAMPSQTVIAFLSLLDFLNQSTLEYAQAIIYSGAISVPYAASWLTYMELQLHKHQSIFEASFDLPIQATQMDPRLWSDFQLIQSQALSAQQAFIAFFDPFPKTLQEKYELAYALLADTFPSDSILPLRNYLSDYLNLLLKDESSALTLTHYHLEQIKSSEIKTNGLSITDLEHLPLYPVDVLYLCQTNQSHYPNYSQASGLFDEPYLQRTAGYPRLETRLNFQKAQREAIHQKAKVIYYSYYDGNYEGKSNDVAFEIEGLFTHEQRQRWPLIHHESKQKRQHGLAADTSKSLFITDGKIIGSVSRFELFRTAPYAYFLKYGLKVFEPSSFNIEFALIGQIRHHLFEQLAARHKAAYTSVSQSELIQLIQDNFIAVEALLPKQYATLQVLKQRILHSLEYTLGFLATSDQTTTFKLAESEYRFNQQGSLSKEQLIQLTGVVDRIDSNGQALRILDYKSSDHDLSETKIRSGLQLQLCTYAVFAQRIFKQPVAGIYYVNLRQPTLIATSASYGMRQGLVLSDPLTFEDSYQQSRLKGWTFMDPDSDYTSASYVKGMKEKQGVVSATCYQLEAIETLLHAIYSDIETQILNGTLDLDPRHSTFTFEYQHFREPQDYQYEANEPFLPELPLKVTL